MKIKSVLFFWLLVGCNSYESETEEYATEDSDYENYENYFDSEFIKKSEDTKCPTGFKEFIINNKKIIMEIPSICNIDGIDKGRPPESVENHQNNELIINISNEHQEI